MFIVWFKIMYFSRQASLTRQAFLITALHGVRYKTKNKNKQRLRQKVALYVIICKINAPPATPVFPTIPLKCAKDQCEALSEDEIETTDILCLFLFVCCCFFGLKYPPP